MLKLKTSTAVIALMALSTATAFSQGANSYDVEIKAQKLTKALAELSDITQLQLIYSPETLAGLETAGASGKLSSLSILEELLAQTSLRIKKVDETTYVIQSASDMGRKFQNISYGENYEENLAVIDADEADDEAEMDEITIVGSSIKISAEKLDMNAQPIELITDVQFQMTAGVSISDFLQSEPVLTGSRSNQANSDRGESTINLRGAGAGFTLSMIDGRRFAGEGSADISALPTIAIQEVQILKAGASAIYGSDAIAGVVNFKLREGYEGVKLNASYGDTTKGGGSNYNVAALFGVKEDRFSFTGSLSYQKRNKLTYKHRAVTQTQDYRSFGGTDQRLRIGPASSMVAFPPNPDNIFTLDPTRFGPGDYSANFNGDFVQGELRSLVRPVIVPESERVSGHWALTFDVMEDDQMTFFSQGYANRRTTATENLPTTYQGIVFPAMFPPMLPPGAPPGTVLLRNFYTPFTPFFPAGVIYSFGPDEVAPSVRSNRSDSFKSISGFRGVIFDNINYEVAYSYFLNNSSNDYTNRITLDSFYSAVDRQDPSALNIFGYWANSAEQIGLLDIETARDSSQNKMQTFDAKINGGLFDWEAGTVKFALGYEHRKVQYMYDPKNFGTTLYVGGSSNLTNSVDRGRDIDAVYGELQVPLYNSDDDQAVVSSVDLTGAARWEKYSDFGNSTVAQAAGRVGFFGETFMIRASYANSFKAPTVEELNRPFQSQLQQGRFDATLDMITPYTRISGGNPDLEPEKGKTWNIGFVWRPDIEDQLLIKVDYWNLRLHNLITTPSVDALLQNTATSGSKTYDPDTGYPIIDVRVSNGGVRNLAGFDFGILYGFETETIGSFSFDFNGTLLTKFDDEGDGEIFDRLGRFSDEAGPIPKFRARLLNNWRINNWSISNVINYSAAYDDLEAQTELNEPFTRRTKAYITVNLQASYTFDEDSSLEGMQIYAGLDDIFNADVIFLNADREGWDQSLSNFAGRSFYLGIRHEF